MVGTLCYQKQLISNGISDIEKKFSGAGVLITDSLGFIGSNLANRLVKAGAHVTIVDAKVPGGGANIHNIIERGLLAGLFVRP
jgi:NAD(P)-dependent dehydrogenase (short-subunit alcohol dehydrogenase family)